MSNTSFQGEFIEQAESIILDNFSNEQFGVSELAELMNMSRSNLLRKIKKRTDLSASQFIRQVRLQKGMELLKLTELSISEISFQVGFGNNSYFTKCFREHYGFSPGEARKRAPEEVIIEDNIDVEHKEDPPKGFFKQYRSQIIAATLLIVVVGLIFFFNKTFTASKVVNVEITKSIAVLPIKNMSSDSTNLYFVNGLMESALNNLQKIEDLRVISRTSVEKYRNTVKTIPEIAEELNVNYIVEGSGQRVGDQVLLNIQLIEVSSDRPIWVEQYSREVGDVFVLQNEVAKKIADAIEAIVTPAELAQIDKKPTEDLVAYDYYLQALEPFNAGTKEGLEEAIPLFEKALEHDSKFALGYSKIAISYYWLDIYQVEKQYTDIINNNADKALLYDPKSAESLIAKALYYMHSEEYRLVLPHLEKALEYNPNSSSVIQMLSNLYAYSIPNTAKYLRYALKGIQLDIAANDSIAKSYIYLSLSNALIQTGFTNEALKYIDLSLNYYPENDYAPYLKALIEYAKNRDLDATKKLLIQEWRKDTTRLDIMQEVAKFYYYQEDYDSAFHYYEKYVNIKKENGLDIYPQEDLKIGIVYEKMGFSNQATDFYNAYSEYCESDQSIYQPASMAMKYLYYGKFDLAIEQLSVFSAKNNYQYWMLVFLEIDPILEPLKSYPKFDETMLKIESRFWENQNELKKSLEESGLI